jgi:hypothetical protein
MQTQILGLVTPIMALILAVTFALLWRLGHMKRHVLGFGIAFALSAVGFLHAWLGRHVGIGLRASRA